MIVLLCINFLNQFIPSTAKTEQIEIAKVINAFHNKSKFKLSVKTSELEVANTPSNLLFHDNNREVVKIKCLSPTAYGDGYDGFLDVAYLKSLLSLLNEKNLSKEDREELDEFQVYLMNFASRQPYRSERIKLNNYLSNFIKKLARYDVC